MLGTEKVKSPQGMVDALRFSTRPLPKLPQLPDDKLDSAVNAVKAGSTSIEKIQKQYSLTAEQLKALQDV